MAEKKHRVEYEVTARDGTRAAFDSVKRNLAGVESAGRNMQNVLGGVGAAVAALGLREMVSAALEAEQAGNRVTAVLRAQGAAATFAKREIDEMADELFELTQFDDESVRNAAATLLKFGNIHGDVFKRALKLSADYAAFTGQDLATAAQVVGKALQSPVEGMGMLERQIGKLTPEQDKHIRKLVEQKKGIEAQSYVLEILQGKIGGTAELMNTGLTKATSDISKQWNELMETFGKTDRGERALSGLASILRDIRSIVEGTKTPLNEMLLDIADVVDKVPGLGSFVTGRVRQGLAAGGQRSGKIKGVDGRPLGETVAPQPPNVTLGGNDNGAKEADAIAERFRGRLRALEQEARKVFGGDTAVEEMKALLASEKEFKKMSAAQKEALLTAAARVDTEKALALVLKQNAEAIEQEAKDYSEAWSFVAPMQAKLQDRQFFENIFGEDALIGKSLEEIRAWYKEYLLAIDTGIDIAERGARVYATFSEDGTEYLGLVKNTKKEWEDLGITMVSSLDSVGQSGLKARDIVRSLGLDLAKILYRRGVLEPAGKALGGAFNSIFGDSFLGNLLKGGGPDIHAAHGSSFGAGDTALVGEEGPELVRFGRSGRVFSNGDTRELMGGGTVVEQHFHFALGLSQSIRAELVGMMPQIRSESVAAVQRAKRSGQIV